MKLLCVRQPWASLIATGDKSIELRQSRTDYRGPLIVVSTLDWDPVGRARVMANVQGHEAEELFPMGVTLCLVDLVEVRLAQADDEERAWGAVPAGSYAWVLGRPQELPSVEYDLRGEELCDADPELLRVLGLLA